MSYKYPNEKERLFTEEGLNMYIEIRDRVKDLLRKAGAFTMGSAICGTTGDSWLMLACVDRMLEKGEFREVTNPDYVAAQNRVFAR